MHVQRSEIRSQSRQGTIYVLVLISSLIVATIGLASLQLIRLQARMADDSTGFNEARAYARAAIEIGLLKIRSEPNWRTRYGNGDWFSEEPIGHGSFTLSATDPVDNDIATGDNHPVVFTGTGLKGEARFKTSVRMEVGPRTGSCLEVAMLSGNDTIVTGATLSSTETVSANHSYQAGSGAMVNADVEAISAINGSTYTRTTSIRSTTRNLPDASHVFDYYLARGTSISYSALPMLKYHNFLNNPGFETSTSSWYATASCQLDRSSTFKKSGSFSMRVRNRATATAVAAQDLSLVNVSRMISGRSYTLLLPFVPTVTGTYNAVLTITSTGSGTQIYTTPSVTIASGGVNQWRDLTGTIVPDFSGTATAATVKITAPNTNDYYQDDVSLKDNGYPDNTYYMDRIVLSPASNPFGATNAEGIYVINCGGKDVVIQNCRIVGTALLIDPGPASMINESIVWEPAIYNYPVILTDKTLSIAVRAVAPSESVLGFNLNPAGTPYPYEGGTSNDTLTDAYPARISGLVYSNQDLKFKDVTNVLGVVIARNNIELTATSLSLTFNSTYLNHPPPGFNVGSLTMQVVPGTWQRSVD